MAIAVVRFVLVGGTMIVFGRVRHGRAAVVGFAQRGRDRRVTAQWQPGQQQQHDQKPGDASHRENRITPVPDRPCAQRGVPRDRRQPRKRRPRSRTISRAQL